MASGTRVKNRDQGPFENAVEVEGLERPPRMAYCKDSGDEKIVGAVSVLSEHTLSCQYTEDELLDAIDQRAGRTPQEEEVE